MIKLRACMTLGKKLFNPRASYSSLVDKSDLERCGLIPDVITEAPAALLKIVYPTGFEVDNGNLLTPTQAKDIPMVKYNADHTAFYTLCYTDPDAPSRAEPIFREWHHWLVVNIPGNDVPAGETLSAYIGPAPPPNSGIHRYLFVVYKQQKGKMDFKWRHLDKYNGDRGGFSVAAFAIKHHLGSPVAVNWHQSSFDDYVNIVYKQMNQGPHKLNL